MFSKTHIFVILFSNFIITVKSLVQFVPLDADNGPFSNFKLFESDKVFNFSTINNYLASVILDHDSCLRDTIKLTRVVRKDNETDFVSIINEILDENDNDTGDNKINTNDERVVDEYIRNFINDLENITISHNVNDTNNNKDVDKNRLTDGIRENLKFNHSDIVSDGEFWQPSGRRIFRGDRTKIKYFPFMSFQCGGSIVKSDLIITAASCLQLAWNNRFFRENPAFLSVRVGSTFYKGGGESIPVIEVYFHPDYNPRNLYSNLCLLRLSRRLKFSRRNRKVKKIDIDRTPMKLPMTTDGITIIGWGAKGTSNILEDPWKNRLFFTVLDFYPLQECREVYSNEYVTNKHFCAGFFSKGGGACNRDVGGPGIVNGILTGVVSFGSPVCGTPDAPTVFTKLGHYSDWIDEIMDQDVPYVYKRTTLKQPKIIPYVAATTPTPKTTFVMSPIGGPMKPMPLNELDILRIPKDESLITEFLKTVFDSKQIASDMNSKGNIRNVAKNRIVGRSTVTEHYEEPLTKMNFEDSTEIVADINKKFTVMENNADLNVEKELEQDVAKLMDNIDMNEVVGSKEISGTEDTNSEDSTKTYKYNDLRQTDKETKKLNDSILTLLYLSDSEKKNNALEDIEDIYDGLTIPVKPFKDVNFRNNDSVDILNILSKSELYDLLAEALNETEIDIGE